MIMIDGFSGSPQRGSREDPFPGKELVGPN